MTQIQEIQSALDLIYEKTGIVFDPKNVVVEMTPEFQRNKRWAGYYAHGYKVYIRPSLFEPIDEEKSRQFYREHDYVHHICNKDGVWVHQTEDDYIADKENIRLRNIQEVIIHEIGHWVHNHYFYCKPMYIRGRGRGHASRNGAENFATAFQQYIQKTIFTCSLRYKRMETILTKELKETEKWKNDHRQCA